MPHPVLNRLPLSLISQWALIVLAGYAAFVPGLAIVYFHNRWTGGWPMLITLVGRLSLVIGLIRMVFPMQLAAIW